MNGTDLSEFIHENILSSFRRRPESSLTNNGRFSWIPACAGMTAVLA
jgi:hypothetical protein